MKQEAKKCLDIYWLELERAKRALKINDFREVCERSYASSLQLLTAVQIEKEIPINNSLNLDTKLTFVQEYGFLLELKEQDLVKQLPPSWWVMGILPKLVTLEQAQIALKSLIILEDKCKSILS